MMINISGRGLCGMTHPNRPPMSIHRRKGSLHFAHQWATTPPHLSQLLRCSCYSISSSTEHCRLPLCLFGSVDNSFGSSLVSYNRSTWASPSTSTSSSISPDSGDFLFWLLPRFMSPSVTKAFESEMDSMSFRRASSFNKIDFTCSSVRCFPWGPTWQRASPNYPILAKIVLPHRLEVLQERRSGW